ncbi:ABC transporter ATP-binding protein [Leucobacter sp. CSA2]|uniref:Fatty acid ABC transporter ATP-binding/permease protein n=1 Tax=Leucobacter edaphi TaxID=2796472 RepID=A0A934UY38_9MICO|nr:ABC transporter ATP-binding protein [Leucobacter edaphi]MBK0422331.1 ABC transporter ATP-binding protein [Leucobacter edaphi]
MAKKKATSPATTAEEEYELPEDYSPPADDWAGGAPAKKAKHFWPSVKRLAGLLKPEAGLFSVVVILVVASVVLTVIAPRILGQAMDVIFNGVIGKQLPAGVPIEEIIKNSRDTGHGQFADMLEGANVVPGEGIDFGLLGRLILIVLALYLVASLLMWLQGFLLNRLVMRIIYNLRRDIEAKINRLPLGYFDGRQRGDVLSRVTNDVDNIQQALQQAFSQLVQSMLTVIGIAAMMFIVSWQLALIALIALPLSGVIAGVVGVRAQKLFVAQWKYTGELNGHIEESFTGHELIRIFNRDAEMVEEFDRRNEGLFTASYQAQALSGTIMPAMQFVQYLSYVLIAVVGALRVTAGQMTLGDVTAFIQYSREFSQPIGEMAGMANMLQSGVASAERTFELLDAEEQDPDTPVDDLPDRTDGHVEFQSVNFSYDPEKPLIEDLSLEASPGHTVAIVGPTGAGKTTLVNLIMRFYELDGGRILLDGVDITKLSRADLRGHVGMVLQDAWLFDGTIRENIRYGRLDASDDEVVEAAKATMVDRFVRQLPEGYDTVISENAASLSAGERQLLTIARAFIANPSLLILDEATSSVDTRTEVLVQQAMRALRSDRTSFVIAHRLSTIRDADMILMMENGRIVEQGSHDELLARRGAYFELYESQFSGGEEEEHELERELAVAEGTVDPAVAPAAISGAHAEAPDEPGASGEWRGDRE